MLGRDSFPESDDMVVDADRKRTVALVVQRIVVYIAVDDVVVERIAVRIVETEQTVVVDVDVDQNELADAEAVAVELAFVDKAVDEVDIVAFVAIQIDSCGPRLIVVGELVVVLFDIGVPLAIVTRSFAGLD